MTVFPSRLVYSWEHNFPGDQQAGGGGGDGD